MTVRAKFKVQSIARSAGWGGHKEIYTVRLAPVTATTPENQSFYAATPGGSIELAMVNADVGAMFDIGQDFYVDFSPADAGQ